MDDQELLKRYARDGDEAAFTELVERYIGMVFGTAHRRIGARGTVSRRRRLSRTSSQSWPGK